MAKILTLDPVAIALDKLYRDAIGVRRLTWNETWSHKGGTTYLAEAEGTTYVLFDGRELHIVPGAAEAVRRMTREEIRRQHPGITARRWLGNRQTFQKITAVAEHAHAQLLDRFAERLAQLMQTLPEPRVGNGRFAGGDNIVDLTGRAHRTANRTRAGRKA